MHQGKMLFATSALLVLCAGGCNAPKNETITGQTDPLEAQRPVSVYPSESTILDGKQLAGAYCGRCHLLPEPGLLDKKTWEERVLPNMALRLGAGPPEADPYRGMSFYEHYAVSQAGVFPDQPLVSNSNWQKIVDYYRSQAPDTLPVGTPGGRVKKRLKQFAAYVPAFNQGKFPLTTLVKFDSVSSNLYVGDRRGNLYTLDGNGQPLDSLRVESPPSDVMTGSDNQLYVLTMGLMDPSDQPLGQLLSIQPPNPNGSRTTTVLEELPRPVQCTFVDLNQDAKPDVIINGFGNHLGKLAWYENLGNGRYREHALKNAPGARTTTVHDFNRDGRPDLMVLMSQGNEGVFLFYNQGNGQFREKTALRFPPVYGSTYAELTDFNRDGAIDILCTNGDNADYSYSLKSYHGIRLYLNDGRDNFKEAWFYPLPGASKATARDFDLDGDLDIAAISFFPDFEQRPEEGFVYLENRGNLQFEAATFETSTWGRWLTFDTGDVDQDGDLDVVLGAFAYAATPAPEALQQKWARGPSLLILRNGKR